MARTRSAQTLEVNERRLVAEWAAACAERVLHLFEAECPLDSRPREAIARTLAFSRGDLSAFDGIRNRFGAGSPARNEISPAAASAARSAGQASAICHMGAHGLGAAAYAVQAVQLANRHDPTCAQFELRWQIERMTPIVRHILAQLPKAGEDRAGPLGQGLLVSGSPGSILRELQAMITASP